MILKSASSAPRAKGCPMSEFPQTMERNNYCTMCMECVKSCSKDNIRISPRLPGADMIRSRRHTWMKLISSTE